MNPHTACAPEAHPRVCGENGIEGGDAGKADGSSPRVRGKLGAEWPGFAISRLIPACAGKTQGSAGVDGGDGAHPRVCGENSSKDAGIWVATGSSPRVRGKQHVIPSLVAAGRLIPACAGKTVVPFLGLVSSAAHPRVCGENDGFDIGHGSGSGSSPRVRGKHALLAMPSGDVGLIPACAGKTAVLHGPRELLAAHPRVCGENLLESLI